MKIWKITCCNMCPKMGNYYKITGSYAYCYREKKTINDISKIPKWCTLPEYGEEK